RGLGTRFRERATAGSHHRRRTAPQRDAARGNRDRPQAMSMHEVSLTGELHPYYVIDVFTDTPLEGNQLGVFPDGQPFSDEQMQRIARELNLSETVFLLPPERGGDARMRIFTPLAELPFAGTRSSGRPSSSARVSTATRCASRRVRASSRCSSSGRPAG